LDLQLTVVNRITLPRTESYYADSQRGLVVKLHEAICTALDMAQDFIDFANLDTDGDGMIDAITFIH